MHPLATELNQALSGTIPGTFLSRQAQRLYFPKGIVAQAQEAGRLKARYDATAGVAREQNRPFLLPSLQACFPRLSPAEAVDYAPTGGDPALRAVWRRQQIEKNPGLAGAVFSLPLVTAGVTHSLTLAADLFIDEGDIVLCPDPAWDNYELVLKEKRGADFIQFPFFDEQNRFNSRELGQRLAARAPGSKTALLLNFPNNPTGYALTVTESATLTAELYAAADSGRRLLVICDDAYFGLFFEKDVCRESLFSHLAGLHPNLMAVKLDGATKEDFAWGFRIGFITLAARGLSEAHYAALENKLIALVRVSVSSASRPAQSLLVRLMENNAYRREKAGAFAKLERRYRKMKEIVEGARSNALTPLPFNAGYFLTFRTKGVDARVLRERLLAEKRAGVIALGPDLLRVSWASVDEADLPELFRLIFETADDLTAQTQGPRGEMK
jgi:aspartate/methionine/tyrosine aminotransferase